MREIKFRAWNTKTIKNGVEKRLAEMVYFDLTGLDEDLIISPTSYIDEETIVEQFTGLLDKNGNEIYEGDIVEYIDKGRLMESGVYQVVYKEGAFRPICELYHPAWPNGWSAEQTCKVIGNIYENPVLLGKKEE